MSEPASPTADPLALLDDYTSGAMPDSEAESFEEALFARVAHGHASEADFADTLRHAAEWIARRGTFNVGNTRAEIDALLASGFKVEYRDFGDASVPVDIPPLRPDTEIFVYRVGIDLRGYDGADVVIETPSGEPIKTFRDIRFDPTDGELFGVCEAPLAEIGFRSGPARWKLIARRGAERVHVGTLETRPVG